MTTRPVKQKPAPGRFPHTAVIVALVVVLLLVLARTVGYKREIIMVEDKARAGRIEIDRLQRLLGSRTISKKEIEELKNRGLTDPIADLKRDLLKHPELIPRKEILGKSKRGYREDEIYVLGSRWVLAAYTDGRQAGKMLLKFQVRENGRISWQVIDAYLE